MTTQIKKAYSEIFELLTNNKDALVSSLMPQLLVLMSAKTTETSYKVDGEVVAVYCYYHKKWEKVSEHAYGQKAGSSTGLNTMCKLGVSEWTKQQRQAKRANELLLAGLADGTVSHLELHGKLAEIEASKDVIVYAENYGQAYDSLEELTAVKKAKKSK